MATMTKVLIHLPMTMKRQLDALKAQGYTASGFVRAAIEKALLSKKKGA